MCGDGQRRSVTIQYHVGSNAHSGWLTHHEGYAGKAKWMDGQWFFKSYDTELPDLTVEEKLDHGQLHSG